MIQISRTEIRAPITSAGHGSRSARQVTGWCGRSQVTGQRGKFFVTLCRLFTSLCRRLTLTPDTEQSKCGLSTGRPPPPRNGVKSSVPGIDPFAMHFDYAYYDRIDLWNEAFHSVSGVDSFIMRIYIAHITGVTVAIPGRSLTRRSGRLSPARAAETGRVWSPPPCPSRAPEI